MANFSQIQVQQVWEKAKKVDGYNPDRYRQDYLGAWIAYEEYGKQSKLGWNIDHLYPESIGGVDNLDNLAALHWQNNIAKGDDYPCFKRAITSVDNRNVQVDDKMEFTQQVQSQIAEINKVK